MTEQDQEEIDLAIIKRHAAQLAEHFDSVQVFATRKSEDGTVNAQWGEGNWFARFGQVRAWLVQEEGQFHSRGSRREDD